MKQAELQTILENGTVIMKGVYWSGKVETINVRAKSEGGPRRSMHVVRETVLTEKDPISVTRWLDDNQKPEDFKPAAAKNKPVVVIVTGMKTEQGVMKLTGTVYPLE